MCIRDRYKSGITTQREVVNNQRDLTDSEVRYIISVTSYNILLADLSRQTGLDNIKPCDIKVNQPNQIDIDSKSNLYESNLIPLCHNVLLLQVYYLWKQYDYLVF